MQIVNVCWNQHAEVEINCSYIQVANGADMFWSADRVKANVVEF